MNYEQTLEYMMSQLPMYQRLGRPAFKPDLKKSWDLMELLANPHQQFKSVHIAGTNGKGSTAHYLASMLMEKGWKVGLYTSPHLKDFRERIRINKTMIPKDYVTEFIEKYRSRFEKLGLSFFEMTVGMAFRYFVDEQVDIAVVEVGMGGRLDSTNVITPELSVITNIGRDHTFFLGDTLPEIAGEKAGIMKEHVPVVIGQSQEDTIPVFEQKARQLGCEISYADKLFALSEPSYDENGEFYHEMKKDGKLYLHDFHNPLAGKYQSQNIITAVAAADYLARDFGIDAQDIKRGIKNVVSNTGLKGRWQVLGNNPLTICDTGHNSEGISFISRQIQSLGKEKIHFVISTVNDKNLDDILSLLPGQATYYFCKANIPRGLPAQDLQKQAEKVGLLGNVYGSVKEAFDAAKRSAGANDLVFVGGSTFTVAEVL